MYYDQPDLLKDINQHLTTLWISIWEEIMADVEIDCCHVWEDMSSTLGTMISPAHFEEFMAPYYRKITDFLRGKGVDIILVDTDGNIEALIPQFLEAGVTGMYPMETTAGMDVVKLRKQYPKFQMMGGVPKYDMALGQERIEEFLAPVNELLKYGGYVPHGDHLISPGVSWEQFRYYRTRLNEIIDSNGSV
jgi:uroporphyrinogen decarboxylase